MINKHGFTGNITILTVSYVVKSDLKDLKFTERQMNPFIPFKRHIENHQVSAICGIKIKNSILYGKIVRTNAKCSGKVIRLDYSLNNRKDYVTDYIFSRVICNQD